jgi:carbon starvation protein CstA
MVTEMCVGVMALIAACAMEPGQYFAINMAGTAEVVTAKDTPCRVSTPTAVIANRMEIPLDNKEKEIRRLQEENALLRKLLQELKN